MSSRELIAEGYAPGSVYKARRQVATAGNLPVKPRPTKDETPPAVAVEDVTDNGDGWIEDGETPCEELESLRSQLDRATATIEELQGQTSEVRRIGSKVKELMRQVESLTDHLAAAEKENTLWRERWDQVVPLLAAMCTTVHCFSETVEPGLPEHAKRRASEAMAAVQVHSKYKQLS